MMFFLETLGVNEVRSLEAEMAQVKADGEEGTLYAGMFRVSSPQHKPSS